MGRYFGVLTAWSGKESRKGKDVKVRERKGRERKGKEIKCQLAGVGITCYGILLAGGYLLNNGIYVCTFYEEAESIFPT